MCLFDLAFLRAKKGDRYKKLAVRTGSAVREAGYNCKRKLHMHFSRQLAVSIISNYVSGRATVVNLLKTLFFNTIYNKRVQF